MDANTILKDKVETGGRQEERWEDRKRRQGEAEKTRRKGGERRDERKQGQKASRREEVEEENISKKTQKSIRVPPGASGVKNIMWPLFNKA